LVKIRLCVISTMPPGGGGVSTYTKSLISSFDTSDFEITILSKKNRLVSKSEPLEDKAITILPCWEDGFLYPFKLFKVLCRLRPQIVHVQHEFFLFGGLFSALMFPFFIFLNKFLHSKLIVTLHGIVNPVELKDPELGSVGSESLKGMPMWLAQMGLLLITRSITDFSDKIIVMNNSHRSILTGEYRCSPKKIVMIPHGVPHGEIIPQEIAKKKLGFEGFKVAFYFGYITKYKGIDILVKAFKKIESEKRTFLLVIGGGPHPRLKFDRDYQAFWDSITQEISKDKQIRFVGFIPEDLLSTYISASDVVVFPYVASFSTGGPMNITLGHYRPIIASRVSSFSDVLPDSAIFKTGSVSDLSRVLLKAIEDNCFNLELSKLAKSIADNRSWKQVAKSTADLYLSIQEK
jgi:glycosyltransferase involved in cell wall biosynthesis